MSTWESPCLGSIKLLELLSYGTIKLLGITTRPKHTAGLGRLIKSVDLFYILYAFMTLHYILPDNMQDDPTTAKMCTCACSEERCVCVRDLYVYLLSDKKSIKNMM